MFNEKVVELLKRKLRQYYEWKKRTHKDTRVIIYSLEDMCNNYYVQFWDKTQEMLAGWKTNFISP